jgi:hypothetical protein
MTNGNREEMAARSQPSGDKSAATKAADRLADQLAAIDRSLASYESDWNADSDMLGNVEAKVNVTGLRVEVRKAIGIHEARQEFAAELLAALKLAHHALTAGHNLRVTDLYVEEFEAQIANDVPRDRLEWFADYSLELAALDAAIAKAHPEARSTAASALEAARDALEMVRKLARGPHPNDGSYKIVLAGLDLEAIDQALSQLRGET